MDDADEHLDAGGRHALDDDGRRGVAGGDDGAVHLARRAPDGTRAGQPQPDAAGLGVVHETRCHRLERDAGADVACGPRGRLRARRDAGLDDRMP